MRKAAVKHPIAASVFVVLVFMAASLAGSFMLAFAPGFFKNNGDLVAQFTLESLLCLVGILMMTVFGYKKTFYNTSKFWTGVACSAFLILEYSLSGLASLALEFENRGAEGFFDGLLPAWRIAFLPLATLSIGFAEECFFRGVVANLFWDKHAKDPAGVWTAALYSGLVFGMVHLLNLFGSDPSGIFVQVTAVCFIGVAMAAIYYRCRNIWVMILLHGYMDCCGMISIGLFGGNLSEELGSYGIMTAIVSSVPYLIVSLILLRKSKTIEALTGAKPPKTSGYISTPDGARLVVGMDMPSSPESKKSLRRAVIIFAVIVVLSFTAAALTSPEFEEAVNGLTGAYVLDYEYQGSWAPGDELTLGRGSEFEIDEAGDYEVTLITIPSDSDVDMVLQIKENGAEIYSSDFGGICTATFEIYFEEGSHELDAVYSFAKLDGECTVDTTVRIKKSR